ncbi:MAG TPA: selenide, water dikinase SelD, partial [Acidobacteria bacterium]|nr:selenide, water dikinase SelD [Acidobacteriota bacterium]
EASGLAVEIELGALPLMPGAREAAEMGLVPAGTGKNRESVGEVLEIAGDADPILVDLALDPQTSGGLLAALPATDAERLVRRLPGAAVVGRAVAGATGTVRLV